MIHNTKFIILAVLCLAVSAVSMFYIKTTHDARKQTWQHKLVGEWVHVDGLCERVIKPGKITGFDITADYRFVENGHQRKIDNIDFVSVDNVVGKCHFLEDYNYEFKVVINAKGLNEFLYAKPKDGYEILKKRSGENYFRFTPVFKKYYDQTVSELAHAKSF